MEKSVKDQIYQAVQTIMNAEVAIKGKPGLVIQGGANYQDIVSLIKLYPEAFSVFGIRLSRNPTLRFNDQKVYYSGSTPVK